MSTRKIIGAAAISAALGGGAVAGAVLGTPSLSAAEVPLAGVAADSGSHRGPGRQRLALDVAAEALGISEDDLNQRLDDGDTIAEVAEAEGVELQAVVDALVEAGTEAIDEGAAEAKEALPERIAEAVERDWSEAPDRGRFGHLLGIALDAATDAIGISEDELREGLRDGSTLAELAEANGVDPQAVIDALVAAASERIDEAVADGDLSEDEAAERKEDLAERTTDVVNGELPFRPGGHHHGRPGG